MRKVGRPKGRPKELTTVYISTEAISLLARNKVNKSQFFDQVTLMTFSDPDRLKLSELRERKGNIEVELASLEAQIRQLEARMQEAARIRRETDIERLVDAWFFRKLVKEGRAHSKRGLANGYSLSVEFEDFLSDRRRGLVSDDSPLEQFLPYSPLITSRRGRIDAKLQMAEEMAIREENQ